MLLDSLDVVLEVLLQIECPVLSVEDTVTSKVKSISGMSRLSLVPRLSPREPGYEASQDYQAQREKSLEVL